jgi:hypothetical protein
MLADSAVVTWGCDGGTAIWRDDLSRLEQRVQRRTREEDRMKREGEKYTDKGFGR